jgi:hypothetical protein
VAGGVPVDTPRNQFAAGASPGRAIVASAHQHMMNDTKFAPGACPDIFSPKSPPSHGLKIISCSDGLTISRVVSGDRRAAIVATDDLPDQWWCQSAAPVNGCDESAGGRAVQTEKKPRITVRIQRGSAGGQSGPGSEQM